MTCGVPHSFGDKPQERTDNVVFDQESWRDKQQNSQPHDEVVKQAAPRRWEDGERKGPWKGREGPWEEREGPWEEREGPWEEREGPWEEREGPWEEREGPWEERKGPWEEREGPWEEREGPWEEREGPWEEREGPWEEREGPWEEREGQWEEREGQWEEEEGPWEEEEGPWGDREGPWEEREIAFEADVRVKQLKEQRVQLESNKYDQQNIIHGVWTEQDDETNEIENSTGSAGKIVSTASSDLGSTKQTARTTDTVTEEMFTDGFI